MAKLISFRASKTLLLKKAVVRVEQCFLQAQITVDGRPLEEIIWRLTEQIDGLGIKVEDLGVARRGLVNNKQKVSLCIDYFYLCYIADMVCNERLRKMIVSFEEIPESIRQIRRLHFQAMVAETWERSVRMKIEIAPTIKAKLLQHELCGLIDEPITSLHRPKLPRTHANSSISRHI